MSLLKVRGLKKSYPGFSLEDVSFTLEKGYIMGFIGRNGAGKTTTLKCIYNILRRDNGNIFIDDKEIDSIDEITLKEDISLMLGGVDYFPNTKVKKIAETVSRFYSRWDSKTFNDYLERFEIDREKKYKELSNGMKSKFYLAMAMSHNAKLLLLDEPTSGLDPFSREEILSIFQEYITDGERSILFSTQIVSDLERVADYLIYIKKGRIIDSGELETVRNSYLLVKGGPEDLKKLDSSNLLGLKKSPYGFEALAKEKEFNNNASSERNLFIIEKPSLEQIMVLREGGCER